MPTSHTIELEIVGEIGSGFLSRFFSKLGISDDQQETYLEDYLDLLNFFYN